MRRAKLCSGFEHLEQLEKAGAQWDDAEFCLLCAIERGVTFEEHGTRRLVHECADRITAWALEVGAVSRDECDRIARLALTTPTLFRAQWEFEALKAMDETLERARQELRGAYAAQTVMVNDGAYRTRMSLEGVQRQLASALALLEEIR
jgi:hypothetical protein